jgi:hypothetical protein
MTINVELINQSNKKSKNEKNKNKKQSTTHETQPEYARLGYVLICLRLRVGVDLKYIPNLILGSTYTRGFDITAIWNYSQRTAGSSAQQLSWRKIGSFFLIGAACHPD